MVIPAPREVDAVMRRVRMGKVTTINEIRAKLARKHGAAVTCPITTGIFAWIAANAAHEAAAGGAKRITPYWRTLKLGGELNEKYPGGIAEQRRLLEREGHRVVAKGKRWVVLEEGGAGEGGASGGTGRGRRGRSVGTAKNRGGRVERSLGVERRR